MIQRDEIDDILAATSRAPYNTAVMFGPPGTGKTFTAFAAKLPDQEVVAVTLTQATTKEELVGHFLVKGGETIYHDNAPVLYAMEHGCLLIINEIDKARGEVEDILHVVLDDRAMSRFRLADGREVSPTGNFRVIGTMNGDIFDLTEAVLDRVAMRIPVYRPTPEATRDLPDDVQRAVEFMYDDAERRNVLTPAVTYRQLRTLAGLRKLTSETNAADLVTGSPKLGAALVELLGMMRLAARQGPQALVNPFDGVATTAGPRAAAVDPRRTAGEPGPHL